MSLTSQILSGDPRAVARAISIAEFEGSESRRLISLLHAHTGHATVIGLTGPLAYGAMHNVRLLSWLLTRRVRLPVVRY